MKTLAQGDYIRSYLSNPGKRCSDSNNRVKKYSNKIFRKVSERNG
jgi:hypothetical protein